MKKKNIYIKKIYKCGIVLIIFLILALNSHQIKDYTVIPMQNGINIIGCWLFQKEDYYSKLRKFRTENENLQKQISTLSMINESLLMNQYELNRLEKLNEIDKEYLEYDKVGAEVIGVDDNFYTNFLYSAFTINKGSDDGIKEGMNVLAEGGLVGIVSEVKQNSSVVRSIIDNNNNVSAMISSTSSKSNNCIVSGNIKLMSKGNVLSFFMISENYKNVKIGDKIVTSDISDKYLKGLLIGYISDISFNNYLPITGQIQPSVDFKHINEVLVIKSLK